MGRKIMSLEEIAQRQGIEQYSQLAEYIYARLEEGCLKPVKSHGTNGKKPALYKDYYAIEEPSDDSGYLEEIQYQLSPQMDISYYLAHPEQYRKEREAVLALSRYLDGEQDKLLCPVSLNERSFEIWGREKFLSSQDRKKKEDITGKKILRHSGITLERLNIYETAEPLAYYCRSRKVPQNIVIVENKDTFYSMRRYLLEKDADIFGMPVDTLIYGAGKGILKSFRDRELCVEPYVQNEDNQLYYFGDLDFEGIRIYEQLQERFQAEVSIRPFLPAYETMVQKGLQQFGLNRLPETKKGQNRVLSGVFMKYFPEEIQRDMYYILDRDKYIPQEIINIQDY